jgi:hypothetical protein
MGDRLNLDMTHESCPSLESVVVEAFTDYYDANGSDKTDGLIAGLIKYKELLDIGDVPIQ